MPAAKIKTVPTLLTKGSVRQQKAAVAQPYRSAHEMKTFSKKHIHEELLKSLTAHGWSVQRYTQLMKAFRKGNPTFVADALIDFLVDEKGRGFVAQDLAGKILLELNAKPSSPLKQIVKLTLPNWDKSVEELPWFLARQFGESELRKALAEIRLGADEQLSDLANTFEWWLGTVEFRDLRDAE